MSYGVYHTDMIVLGVMPSGEASNIYTILTRELGIVRAKAQSVRKVTSKLRFGLQYLSLGTIDLIRAKDFWRIVGVSNESSLVPTDITHKPLHRIVTLLSRIVPQDEGSSDMYDTIVSASDLFSVYQGTQYEEAIEIISVARILALSGYWDDALPVYENTALLQTHLDDIMQAKKSYLRAINTAIAHTQL